MKKVVFHSDFVALATGMLLTPAPGTTELPGCERLVRAKVPELLPEDAPEGFTVYRQFALLGYVFIYQHPNINPKYQSI